MYLFLIFLGQLKVLFLLHFEAPSSNFIYIFQASCGTYLLTKDRYTGHLLSNGSWYRSCKTET